MELIVLGSGAPLPMTTRGGQSLAVQLGNERVLVDCGPQTVERILEAGLELGGIETLFFSHQHMDHNASFFHFAITSWMYGRRRLTVYGPEGTEPLLEALEAVYREDLAYRSEYGRPIEAITDIEFTRVHEGFEATLDGGSVAVQPVDHTIETYAYRFEAGDDSLVYSADTGNPEPLYEFAKGADILVQNCGVAPAGGNGSAADETSWRQYQAANPPHEETPMVEQHCTPEQAATVAAEADAGVLVLTHLLPMRDIEAIRSRASAVFDGPIRIAEDGMTVTPQLGRT